MMISKSLRLLALCFGIAAAPALALAAVQTNQPAPAFTAMSASGEAVSLANYAGKTVVLEWSNHGCPFVKKFYEGGQMQAQQKAATDAGTIWLRVISSAKGKQGHLEAAEALAQITEKKIAATHTLLDASGELGRLYGAKTTPHMYVINPQGVLVYQGAIDSNPSTDAADIAGATNYVAAALEAVAGGKVPATQETKAYGCSIKY